MTKIFLFFLKPIAPSLSLSNLSLAFNGKALYNENEKLKSWNIFVFLDSAKRRITVHTFSKTKILKFSQNNLKFQRLKTKSVQKLFSPHKNLLKKRPLNSSLYFIFILWPGQWNGDLIPPGTPVLNNRNNCWWPHIFEWS